MLHKIILGLCVVMPVVLGACTKDGVPVEPREVLAKYVETAFVVKNVKDLEPLKQYLSGDALKDLQSLIGDEKLFKKTFEEQKIESASSLKIRDEKKLADGRYSITYELTYRAQSPAGKVETAGGVESTKEASVDKVTTKKHALFERSADGKWSIAEVRGMKTFIEHVTDENISVEKKQEEKK